jgi:NAD(P)H-hydrate epimerase
MKLVTKAMIKKVYHERPINSKKGDYGRVLIVGGSVKYTGAPVLAARAALAAGCDLAYIAAPERAANIAARTPDLITYPIKGEYIKQKNLKQIMKISSGKDAVLIGNGLCCGKSTNAFARNFVKRCEIPMVIDADALHAIKKMKFNGNVILTPHAGEFFALTGEKTSKNINERALQVRHVAKKINATILLKGREDIISDGVSVYVNKTGNAYMTKGGTGDVLAGICVSLLAQLTKKKTDALTAACAAAYINGAAGDAVANKKRYALLASDIIDEIPKII